MINDELAFQSAYQLSALIRNKDVSPVELIEMFFQRIDKFNPSINAYLSLGYDQAIVSAKKAEDAVINGLALGPLHGIPISIKDLESTKGILTTLGSLIFKDTIPKNDTVVVKRIKNSGAIILGKTNTPEFGLSGTTENRLGDSCRNPWDISKTAGGSSGGAASALASGLCTLASGSDGGGSIRIPSSFCGVYGIKPSQGRVPRYGGMGKPAFSQFSQPGPMARTVQDSVSLLQILAGPDPHDYTSNMDMPPNFMDGLDGNVKDMRIGWSPDFGYASVDPEVMDITLKAVKIFEELGSKVEEIDLSFEDSFTHFFNIFSSDVYAAFGALTGNDLSSLSKVTITTFEHAQKISGADYSRSLFEIHLMKSKMDILMKDYDILLSPTTAVTAFPVGQRPRIIAGEKVDPFWGFLPFTFPINMTGQPAASIPCGFSNEGLPVGLHIIGQFGDEMNVIRASAAFEQAMPWIDKKPAIGYLGEI
jgi:aspartyl-tRNA(Asn)/glutamyl-tRNA(Gln) amidotransferase subunit A